jgi:teichoic acid transport system permease protein
MPEQTVQTTDEELPQPAEGTSPKARNGKPRRADDEFTTNYHVYEPFQAGLPPLGPYFRECWRRRHFALQLAYTKLRARNYDTVLGQLWLVLTPLLMAAVYYMLITIIRGGSRGPEHFAHLVAALFVYNLFAQSVRQGVSSIVGGGKLILNTAFPRLLLPFSAVAFAFRRFLPTIPIAAAVHLIVGVPVGWETLLVIPIIAIVLVTALGVACLVAACQVYVRDLSNFVRPVLRVGHFTTPILYTAEEAVERGLGLLMWVNPMAPAIRALGDAVDHAEVPQATVWAAAVGWAVFLCIAGVLFFLSRERELAVRL